MASGHSAPFGEGPVETPLALFIVQMLLIVIISRVMAYLFKYIKRKVLVLFCLFFSQEPPVIAEVVTGIVLGPSVFGKH
jgi:hypothetical protein